MTEREPDPSRRASSTAVGRHRAARQRAMRRRRRRAAALGGSMLVTLVVVVLAAVRPSSDEPAASAATNVSWADDAVMPTLTPAPKPTPTKTTPAPEPTDFPQSGEGTFATAAVADVAGAGSGRNRRYSVEVEGGLPQDPDRFARQVAQVLGDERGWRSDGWSFEQVEGGGDFQIMLASPDTVDRLCAPLLTRGEVSCRSGSRVVLNVKRWALGVQYYGDDLSGYRTYLVNHEVGHALGKYHVGCPAPGAKAPVMLQQTKGLQGCVKNPWP
ncbi:DUF3152 domain-containing protein [Aeromicrobium sp.]|uniref:DUF3152 domain-containing protein n=1 Tax=Aeromicrobium sp. TaxID=1871063 RepID=UPI004034E1A2